MSFSFNALPSLSCRVIPSRGSTRIRASVSLHFLLVVPTLPRFLRPSLAIPVLAGAAVFFAKVGWGSEASAEPSPARAELVNVPQVSQTAVVAAAGTVDFDSLAGRSGALRVRIMEPSEAEFYPGLMESYGDAARQPGVRPLSGPSSAADFQFITMAPWTVKLGSYIGNYQVGYWPAERSRVDAQYANPAGFIEVTQENASTRLSEHFTIADFLTHDQKHVWPKYVVLREDLLDKLELMLDALQRYGVATNHVVVLSGFRTPQYNSRGVGEGMARSSRHQFGDAADLIIDANRDGRMDDLNMDGRVNFEDVRVIDRAVQLIERQYPELVGGLGLYHEMGPSGPFAHIDVRGTRARWTNSGRPRSRPTFAGQSAARPATGRCHAEGAMAVLCAGVN